MKKIALAAAFAGAASTAFAGGMSEPIIEMDPIVVVEEAAQAASSSSNLIVPLIIVALIAAATAS